MIVAEIKVRRVEKFTAGFKVKLKMMKSVDSKNVFSESNGV